MYSLTIFKNTYYNKTHRTMSFDSWDKFEELLYKLSNERGAKGGNNSSALISPARFDEGRTRSNKSVNKWGAWSCLDVDSYILADTSGDVLVQLKKELYEKFGAYHYVCYSTASSTEKRPKFRLVFPLTKEVDAKDLSHFWFAMNKQFKEIGDEQTKDLARMYYVPAQYPNAFNFIFTNDGVKLDPEMLMEKHSYIENKGVNFLDRLPPELQKAVVEHRKSKLDNTNINWSGYRDCPFWSKKLETEYRTITESGWYYKMYQIMVATSGNAVSKGYPITAQQIASLCKEFDAETGGWYKNRDMVREADRALEYVYRNRS